jgi:hypothetical protein
MERCLACEAVVRRFVLVLVLVLVLVVVLGLECGTRSDGAME